MDAPATDAARPRPRLDLIGPGRLGRTLARLWQRAGCLETAGIAGRGGDATAAAAAFIGGGRPCDLADLPAAEFYLLATPDAALADAAAALAAAGVPPGAVVFHCSGALSSEILAPLIARGARVASVHPLKSFADPTRAVEDFAGTCCGHEGDTAALARLLPLFEAIGGRCFAIDPAQKSLYHAGAVLACNALTALMEAALRSMEAAGLPRDAAWPALAPLVAGTLANIGHTGPADALTGPVARGDADVVAAQLTALARQDAGLADIYRALGRLSLDLAEARLPPSTVAAMHQILNGPSDTVRSAD